MSRRPASSTENCPKCQTPMDFVFEQHGELSLPTFDCPHNHGWYELDDYSKPLNFANLTYQEAFEKAIKLRKWCWM